MKAELDVELTVADVLARWPETIPVFLQRQMGCVGCTMSPFETLATAAALYHLDLDAFKSDLEMVIQSSLNQKEAIYVPS